jgi:hypothetical protein
MNLGIVVSISGLRPPVTIPMGGKLVGELGGIMVKKMSIRWRLKEVVYNEKLRRQLDAKRK